MNKFDFKFLLKQKLYVFTLNRIYYGDLSLIFEDSIHMNCEAIYELGIDEPTDFSGPIHINKNMIESIFKAED